MNAPCEFVSLGGLLLSVHPIEHITLQPVRTTPSVLDDDNDDDLVSSLLDIHVVACDDLDAIDRWLEYASRQLPNQKGPTT